MLLIDTHAHLDEESFAPDISDVVKRAEQAGLTAMVTIGTTAQSCRKAVELAERFPSVYAAVGIHPNYVSQASDDDWSFVRELTQHPRVVAVGETGLDRYWDYSPLDLQIDYFERHLELSSETGLPFIVHCRDAEPDVLSVLEKAAVRSPLSGIMHSFCGSPDTAERCLTMGLHLSFSGMLTYKKNSGLRDIAAQVPANRLLVETDCPYLAPTEVRGKRNEPAWVKMTAACLAAARGVTPEELGELTTANAKRLFRRIEQ